MSSYLHTWHHLDIVTWRSVHGFHSSLTLDYASKSVCYESERCAVSHWRLRAGGTHSFKCWSMVEHY